MSAPLSTAISMARTSNDVGRYDGFGVVTWNITSNTSDASEAARTSLGSVDGDSIIGDHFAGDVCEGGMAFRRRVWNGATPHSREIIPMRLRDAREQVRLLERVRYVIDVRCVRRTRTRPDYREVVVRDVRDSEAMRRGRRERKRETASAPARKPLADGVDRGDIEP